MSPGASKCLLDFANVRHQTRMQVINPSPAAVYTGIVNAAVRMSTTEGARSLWRGISSVALGAGSCFACNAVEGEMATDDVC
jgi:hypothetical protein